MLQDLHLETEYRSTNYLLGTNLLGELLSNSVLYHRAVGFFSCSVFSVEFEKWYSFFTNRGKMQLVCSPRFSMSDLKALFAGLFDRPKLCKLPFEKFVNCRSDNFDFQAFMAWLIANDKLVIKIACRNNTANEKAMYHEKIAIFSDQQNNKVCLSGSANETRTAWVENFERVDLFRSWFCITDQKRSEMLCQAFKDLWANKTPGLEVMSLFEAFKRGVFLVETEVPIVPLNSSENLFQRQIPFELPLPPTDLALFEHQKRAMSEWGKASGRGILQMATGSGKTMTSLAIASKLYEGVGSGLVILIVAPQIHLVDQWIGVANQFGLAPIRCAESSMTWSVQLGTAIDSLNAGGRPVLSIATTSATLALPIFQERLKMIRKPMLIIADEAHNLGSKNLLTKLPYNATYRLALSATPDRWHDEFGTEALKEYFGNVVFRYELKDAIRDEILTSYFYTPVLIHFEDDEFDSYQELTRIISRYVASGSGIDDMPDSVKTLLIKRARLIATARGILPSLHNLMTEYRYDSQILVYCGDGSLRDDEGDAIGRQIDAAVKLIGGDLQMVAATFTAKTPTDQRKILLEEFSKGRIQAMVAIRCLDEGVDIPSVRTAFLLASSTNPRQFIQRRGRVLRRAPGKTHANIIDFIVIPPPHVDPDSMETRNYAKSLIRSQMKRVAEFSTLAENAPFARSAVHDLLVDYNLLDSWEE